MPAFAVSAPSPSPSPAPPARMLGRLGLVGALLTLAVALPAGSAAAAHPRTEVSRGPAPVASAVSSRAPAAAQDFSEGLRIEDATTYRVDLPAGVVRVENIARITNELTPGYYFTEHWVPVQTGATNVHAELADGTALSTRTEPRDEYLAWAVVTLPHDLLAGEEIGVRLTYDLGSQPSDGSTVSQVNPALATFPLFSGADPGLGSVRVEIPAGLDPEVLGDGMRRSTVDGTVVWAADALPDPGTWTGSVFVSDDDQLVSTTVPYRGSLVVVEGWPGDDAWLERTAAAVADGLPALHEAVGRPWLVHDRLTVREAHAPYGERGWYDSADEVAHLDAGADTRTVLRQLAHAWFEEDLFASWWIDVALADAVSAEVAAGLGSDSAAPEVPDPGAPGAQPLVSWDPGRDDVDAELRATAAATWLGHELVAEIGTEGVAAVVAAQTGSAATYPAPTDARPGAPADDWRRLLDLLEDTGGSTSAEDLFRQVVVTDDGRDLLDERAAARASYAELVEASDGWAPPAQLRRAMAAWRFAQAEALVPRVERLLQVRDGLLVDLEAADVPAPAALQETFETSGDLAELAARLRDGRTAAQVLAEAPQERADLGLLGRLSVDDDSLEADLAAARTALAAGDLAAAGTAAASAQEGLATATRDGAVGLVALVVLAAGAAAAVTLLARRRPWARLRKTPGAAVPAEGTMGA